MTTTIETLASNEQILASLSDRLAHLEVVNMEDKLTLKVLADKINELVLFTNQLEDRASKSQARSRGPASEKVMSEDDARRVMLGDLKGSSHKEAAELLGLSYGQIYSARKGFTFKPVYKEMTSIAKAE